MLLTQTKDMQSLTTAGSVENLFDGASTLFDTVMWVEREEGSWRGGGQLWVGRRLINSGNSGRTVYLRALPG
jgi:hypothetical protein